MRSRMDKYYKDEDVMQRTSKNDLLYEKLYREKNVPRSNETIIDNINEIDITKIKSMVDSREKYKRIKEYERVTSPVESYRTSKIDYDFNEIDNSNYDINEILKNKRSSKNYDNTKVRRINNIEYDIVERNDEEDEISNQEKQLMDLFNTVSRTKVKEETDLFSNLREDVKEDRTSNIDLEKEFYTNSTNFDSDDFSFETKESNTKIFIIIGVIAVVIALGVVIYLKFF